MLKGAFPMAEKKRKNHGFALFITVLVILLMLCIALFVYGSMNNRLPQPTLPGKGFFALGTMLHHG